MSCSLTMRPMGKGGRGEWDSRAAHRLCQAWPEPQSRAGRIEENVVEGRRGPPFCRRVKDCPTQIARTVRVDTDSIPNPLNFSRPSIHFASLLASIKLQGTVPDTRKHGYRCGLLQSACDSPRNANKHRHGLLTLLLRWLDPSGAHRGFSALLPCDGFCCRRAQFIIR